MRLRPGQLDAATGELDRRARAAPPTAAAVRARGRPRARPPRPARRTTPRRSGRPGSSRCRRRSRRRSRASPPRLGAGGRGPASRRRSPRRAAGRPSAGRTSANPPAPGPVSGLSVTQDANAAATQASTAFPPSSSTRAPACGVSGWPAATAPLMCASPLPMTRHVSIHWPNLHPFRTNLTRGCGVRSSERHTMNLSRQKTRSLGGRARSPSPPSIAVAAAARTATSPRRSTSLRRREPPWLGVAALGFVVAFACTVGAWRAALRSAAARICPARRRPGSASARSSTRSLPRSSATR